MLLDVRPDHLQIVQDILQKHVPQYEVWAFGSRAKWTAKEYSDLDLCIVADKPLSFSLLGTLADEFSESDLPYKVDIVDWATTSPSFRKIIERDKVVMQKGNTSEEVLRFGDYATLVKESVNPSDTPSAIYVGLEHIDQGSLTLNGFGYAQDVDSQKLRFKAGDVLFGKLRPYFRKVVVAPFDGVCSTDIWVVRPKAGRDRNFLFYWMAMPEFVEKATQASEGTRMPRAKWEYVSEFVLPAISATVQMEIGKTLRSFDDKIALLRETNATLEAIAQAIFKSWFVDFDPVRAKMEGCEPEGMDAATSALFPDSLEDSELGEIPKGWKAKPLEQACEINPTRRLSKGAVAPYLEMAAIPTQGHRTDSPVLREFSSGTKFINGDTLLARITPCLENGKTAFVDFLAENEVGWGSTEYIVLRPKQPLPAYWAYLLYRHQSFSKFAIQAMVGTSGRQRVDVTRLAQYMVATPDDAICAAFAEVVEPIQRDIAANAESIKTLADLRDTLLPRLMSGKLTLTTTSQ